MWHTSAGDRTLKGAEARLFADMLWDFTEELEIDEGEYITGLDVFDRLTYGQKASLLHIVGNGLLKPEVPACDLTAAVECTIATLFEFLKTEVIVETEDHLAETTWRKSILAARKEAGEDELPDRDSQDIQEWFFQIQLIEEEILWDNDYLSENDFIDDSPEESEKSKQEAGISENYFTDIADDPRPGKIKELVTDIKNLCRSICG